MRRVLLASTLAAALLMQGPPAHALFGVGDVVFDPTSYANLLQQYGQLQQSYSVMVQQYQTMQSTYQTAMSTYNTLTHPTDVLGTARGLLQGGRLPGSPSDLIPGLAYGSTVANGAQRFIDQNHVYTSTMTDFGALELQRRQTATANMQAEAQAGLDRIQGRLASLQELQNSIPQQPDVTAVSAINARINSEQMFIQNENSNVARMQLIQQTQQRVDQQRLEQNDRKDAESWYAAAQARAGGN